MNIIVFATLKQLGNLLATTNQYTKYRCCSMAVLLIFFCNTWASEQQIIDSHIHYNWDQAEITTPQDVIRILKKHAVEFAVLASTPTALALQLSELDRKLFFPLFSPYTHELGKQDWYKNEQTWKLAEQGLKNKSYLGIGEIHFMAGFPPKTDNLVFRKLMQLAYEYHAPTLIHVDASNETIFIGICQQHPEIRIQFAHAGGNLLAPHIEKILNTCENVWIDLSARDPWRYDGLTNAQGKLKLDWRELILKFDHRFMIGTDPVWRVTRTQSWDQADDGWNYYDKLMDYHLRWLSDLPPPTRSKLQYQNAKNFYNFEN
ncbi:MAG: amidohydrolase family protein [Gammaproteobacteria bacterium]|nr:amidohydrolase family protein [Gammaproteobacteria bacterium]